MTPSVHPLAPRALPAFISSPDGTDYLTVTVAIFLVAFVFAIGILLLRLHALPDHIAHKSQKVQYEIVCVLCLLAMFTHVHAFWIAALLLALIDLPDFSTPLRRISGALDTIASDDTKRGLIFGFRRPTTSVGRHLTTPQLSTPQSSNSAQLPRERELSA